MVFIEKDAVNIFVIFFNRLFLINKNDSKAMINSARQKEHKNKD